MALDDPVGESLRGLHAGLGRRLGRVATYLPGVATFFAVLADADAADLAGLAARLLGRDACADMFRCQAPYPGLGAGFRPRILEGQRMIWPGSSLRSARKYLSAGSTILGGARISS